MLCLRIAGNGASEKNLKDGVCAQFEKNFAKAKWRVCIHSCSVNVRLNEVGNNSSRGILEDKPGEDQGVNVLLAPNTTQQRYV